MMTGRRRLFPALTTLEGWSRTRCMVALVFVAFFVVNPVYIVSKCIDAFRFKDSTTSTAKLSSSATSTIEDVSSKWWYDNITSENVTLREIVAMVKSFDPKLPYSKLPSRETIDPCSRSSPLSCVLALGLGRDSYIAEEFPIVIRRLSPRQAKDPAKLQSHLKAIEMIVAYYGIKLVFDCDQSRAPVSRALINSKKNGSLIMKDVQLVFDHMFPNEEKDYDVFLTREDSQYVDYIMDYSPRYNIENGLVPRSPELSQKLIWRPYANMPYDKFLKEISETHYSDLVSSIIASKPFVLACGSNRRDYTGAVLAAKQEGINLIIADDYKTYKDLRLRESPLLKVVKVSHPEFNVLLTEASYVIVPSQLPQSTPVGIGTIARVKMAGKISIAVNNTGTDTMIQHGYDGFFVPDPSAKHEAQYKSYRKIFEELRKDNRRQEMEGNIETKAHTDEVAGAQMVRIASCLGADAIIGTSTMFELHHVNSCIACGRSDWCNFWQMADPHVGIRGKYGKVGRNLEDSCEQVQTAAIVQVVKNSETGQIFVAAACPEMVS